MGGPGADKWDADAREVVVRYRDMGLRGHDLRHRIAKHAKLVRVLDPEFADALEEQPLR